MLRLKQRKRQSGKRCLTAQQSGSGERRAQGRTSGACVCVVWLSMAHSGTRAAAGQACTHASPWPATSPPATTLSTSGADVNCALTHALFCAVLCWHVLPCHRQRLRLLRERDRQLSGYYEMGSSYGKPTPLVLLPFAEMLTAKTDNSLLWWVAHNYSSSAFCTKVPSPHCLVVCRCSPAKSSQTQLAWRSWQALRSPRTVCGSMAHRGMGLVLFAPLPTSPGLLAAAACAVVCCPACRPAAVGLTDQWVHQRLSSQHYASWYKQLADTVAAADANFAAQQQQNQQRHGRGSERLSEGGSGKQPVSTPRLVAEKDYRWVLHTTRAARLLPGSPLTWLTDLFQHKKALCIF